MSLDAALEEAIAELLATSNELADLPPESFERRAELQDRLTDLRKFIADLRSQTPTDRSALRDHLGRLEMELKRRLQNRISHITAGQTGMGGGLDPEQVHALNREIDKGQGIAELQAEIERIRSLLAEG